MLNVSHGRLWPLLVNSNSKIRRSACVGLTPLWIGLALFDGRSCEFAALQLEMRHQALQMSKQVSGRTPSVQRAFLVIVNILLATWCSREAYERESSAGDSSQLVGRRISPSHRCPPSAAMFLAWHAGQAAAAVACHAVDGGRSRLHLGRPTPQACDNPGLHGTR